MNYEIYDDDSLTAFEEGHPDRALLDLVERLLARAKAHDFWNDLTCIVVPHEGANLAELLGAVPEEWDWQIEHGDWVELGITSGDSGFAWIVLVPRGSRLACGG